MLEGQYVVASKGVGEDDDAIGFYSDIVCDSHCHWLFVFRFGVGNCKLCRFWLGFAAVGFTAGRFDFAFLFIAFILLLSWTCLLLDWSCLILSRICLFLFIFLDLVVKQPPLYVVPAKFIGKQQFVPHLNEEINAPWREFLGNGFFEVRADELREGGIRLIVDDGELDVGKGLLDSLHKLKTLHIIAQNKQTANLILIEKSIESDMLLLRPQRAEHIFR